MESLGVHNRLSRLYVVRAPTKSTGKSGEELAGKFVPPVWNASWENTRGGIGVNKFVVPVRNASSKKSQEGISENVDSSDVVEEVHGEEERNVGKINRPNLIEDDVTETFEYAGKVVIKADVIPVVKDAQSHDEVANDDQLDSLEKQSTHLEDELVEVENRTEPEPGLSALAHSSPSFEQLRESPVLAPVEDIPRQPKTNRRVLSLTFLIAIIAIAVILGIVLGGKKSDDENSSNVAVGAVGADDASDGKNNNFPSQSPTTNENATNASVGDTLNVPVQSPAPYCPVGTKSFSIQYTSVKEEVTGTDSYPMTWVLKESCSDNEIAKCLPCVDSSNTSLAPLSSPSSPILFNNSAPNTTISSDNASIYSPTMSASVQALLGLEKYTASSDGVSGCIPDEYQYVFEVKPSDNQEECCGFLPYSFTMSHDDIVVTDAILIFYEFEGTIARVPFPENVEPCPTFEPSSMPSATPSEASTEVPTADIFSFTFTPTFLL